MNRFLRNITLSLLTFILPITLSLSAFALNADGSLHVIPGGVPFGVKFFTDGVIVSAIDEVDTDGIKVSPAKNSGLMLRDMITHINGHKVSSAGSVSKTIADCGGETLTLTIKRGDEVVQLKLTPVKSDGKYKAGLWLKDSTAGIGTVTFIEPETGVFAGLGHGICDSESGKLLPLLRGNVSNVKIGGIRKGCAGTPGELKGYFTGGRTGTLISNTDCGVFGIFAQSFGQQKTVEIGSRDFIHDGEATIICTLDETGPKEYKISISGIDVSTKGNKCFNVSVIDGSLIEKTGGIVQGMSGSPIIQDGKLVGAVTHVLVNDPTRGYGIFIENMLETARSAEQYQK